MTEKRSILRAELDLGPIFDAAQTLKRLTAILGAVIYLAPNLDEAEGETADVIHALMTIRETLSDTAAGIEQAIGEANIYKAGDMRL